jgi:isocitrate dehydrogenase kinase/phosphatase
MTVSAPTRSNLYRAAVDAGARAAPQRTRVAPVFPQRLDSPLAYDIAKAMLDGFNRHYRLFRTESARAKHRFETADWHGQQRAQRERIEFYDLRVQGGGAAAGEGVQGRRAADGGVAAGQAALHRPAGRPPPARAGRDLLQLGHHQDPAPHLLPQRLHLRAARRSAPNTSRTTSRPRRRPTAPTTPRARRCTRRWCAWSTTSDLRKPFDDLERDAGYVLEAMSARLSDVKLRANFQIQVLSSPVLPQQGRLRRRQDHQRLQRTAVRAADAAQQGRKAGDRHLPVRRGRTADAVLFARAYFMVDMEIPSAYVQFLRSLMPRKPRAEIYNALGLAKQGKTLFYRDFLYHLRHSSDKFRIAPGIKGMVMLVFDLPSFPYVFKVIKDYYPPQKDTTREQIKGKYLLVKQHDRVGRMADTLEYSEVAFPRERFEDELIAEIREVRAQPAGDQRPRRRRPRGSDHQARLHRAPHDPAQHLPAGGLRRRRRAPARQQIERAVIEYGNAIKDLVAANIFPGDMLWKNFGVTRNGKVVFYDYDEIEYLTDCNFRKVPAAAQRGRRNERRGLVQGRPQGRVPRDLRALPARQRRGARGLHAAPRRPARRRLLAESTQGRIQAGHVHDVFPYEREQSASSLLHRPSARCWRMTCSADPVAARPGAGDLRLASAAT